MDSKQKEIIEECLKGVRNAKNEFDVRNIELSIEILFAQFGHFNSVGSIGIALMILGLTSSFIEFNILSIASLLSLLFLIVYSNSYIKEGLDSLSKTLIETESIINDKVKETDRKAKESLKEDNPNIFFNFATEQIKKIPKSPNPSYASELVNFSLFLGILSGISSILVKCPKNYLIYFVFTAVIIVSFLFSFIGWSTLVTEKISSFFELIKRFIEKLN